MQFEAAVRCAGRALALTVAVLVAWSMAFAPATRAQGSTSATRAAQKDHRSAPLRKADWSAGPVLRWTGYSKHHGSKRVREVQRTLNRIGYHSGPVDGLFGPITDRAVHRFQARHRLGVDGIVGRHTLRALRAAERHRAGSKHELLNKNSPWVEPKGRPAPVAHQPAIAPPEEPPTLPVTAVLAVLVALGLATMWRGYAQTSAALHRAQRHHLAAAARPAGAPPARDQSGRVRQPIGSATSPARPRGHG